MSRPTPAQERALKGDELRTARVESTRTLDASGPLAQSLIAADHAEALIEDRQRTYDREAEAAARIAPSLVAPSQMVPVPSGADCPVCDRYMSADDLAAGETCRHCGADVPGEAPTPARTLDVSGNFPPAHGHVQQRDPGECEKCDAYREETRERLSWVVPVAPVETSALTPAERAHARSALRRAGAELSMLRAAYRRHGCDKGEIETFPGVIRARKEVEFQQARVKASADARAEVPAVGDTVAVNGGTRLYEVLVVERDHSRSPEGVVTDAGMVKVAPRDPEDPRDPFWVGARSVKLQPADRG